MPFPLPQLLPRRTIPHTADSHQNQQDNRLTFVKIRRADLRKLRLDVGRTAGRWPCLIPAFGYNAYSIKKRPDGLTNLLPGKVDRESGCGSIRSKQPGARRPSSDTLEDFFYV